MEKKTASAIMLTLLLTSMLTLAFNIQPVSASGTIYIRADGSIDPPTAPISTVDNVTYTLTGNINDSIVVERDNIVIDGGGYTVQGTGSGRGIDLSWRINVTIRNIIIIAFEDGIYLYYSSSNSISGNSITANSQLGIALSYSSNNSITGNSITNNGYGLWLVYSSNSNSISGNNIANNWYGIYLGSSSSNSISGNTFTNDGLYVWGPYQNSVENNTVNGRPLVYLEGASNHTVDDAGQVILVRCENIRVEGLNLSRTTVGIELWETGNSTISGNNITANNDYGIALVYSSYNSISRNNITKINGVGINMVYSSGNIITGSSIADNWVGITLYACGGNNITDNDIDRNNDAINMWYSSENIISGNNATSSLLAIFLYNSVNNNINGNNIDKNWGYAIYLTEYSNSNTITDNNMTNTGQTPYQDGISIYLSYSSGNVIVRNNIANNAWNGIRLLYSSNNSIHHNNFINNYIQVESYDSINFWDDSYPSGGNYWSDYIGVDVKNGIGQDLPGSDGVGDAPYVIDADNVDRYPLMNPYGAPPPQTYNLTITTTVGGTTDPAPGTYSYTANSTVQVTAIPAANYLFDYWELDSVNVGSANPYSVYMDKDHTLKAVFSPVQPPLSVSTSPLSASILVGQSATFTSTVSGGYTPYSYQWYLNAAPVSGATSNTWAFTPATSGIYYVYLKVTDAKANTAQSDTARTTTATVPVGGYSIPIQVQTKTEPIIPYIALIAILTAVFTKLRPKTKRKH